MMPPDAQTVHPGHAVPDEARRRRVCAWLEANGIDPNDVVATRPIYVLAVRNGTIHGGLPWLIDVIVFHQFYRTADGNREHDFIAGDAVMFQRTVPLQVPFPTGSTTDADAPAGDVGDQGQDSQPSPDRP